MPLYEYKCSCGHKVEKIKKVSERDNLIPCDNPKGCLGLMERETVVAPAVHYNGFKNGDY